MLKREITYEDFNGDTVTDTVYFNLSKAELLELMVEEGDFAQFLQRIIHTRDNQELVKQFKRFILMGYGEKSDDGKSFNKSDELAQKFERTAAYQALFAELMMDDEKAAQFLMGVFPTEVVQEMEKKEAEQKETSTEGV